MTGPIVRTCPQCGRTYGGADRFCTVDGATLIASTGATIIGTVIADRFLVQEKLGEGGMGEVYLAEHVRIKRKVALKLMRPWMIGDPVAVGRFHREAENASQISHQHVAQVYDFGESSDGMVYLAMEFVEGEPLSTILDREGRLHVVRTVDLSRQIAEALTAAHSLGILHRDLKPDNVMVGRTRFGTDHVKLVDFGIARAMNRTTQAFTSTGLIIGTPDYMSPEQMSGDNLDGRSDLYALALIAYRILTGKSAYPPGSSTEALIARVTQPPLRLTEAVPEFEWPEALQHAFDRALAADPAARFHEPLEFAAELDAAISHMPLGEAEQSYLIALSQRRATPVRTGAVHGAATPVLGVTPIRSMTPVRGLDSREATAVATPPERQSIQTDAVRPPATPTSHPWSGEITPAVLPLALPEDAPVDVGSLSKPDETAATGRSRSWLRPVAVVGVAGAVLAAILLTQRRDTPAAPAASVAASVPEAPVAAPDSNPSATDSGDSAARILARSQRATVAVWAGAQRGTGVLVDDGVVLTSASLVGNAAHIDVYLDQTTRVRGTVLQNDARNGLVALLVPGRHCRRCETVEPDAALEPAVGDSLLALPASARGDGAVVRSAVKSVAAGVPTSTVAPNQLAEGTPVFSARTGALVSLRVRRPGGRGTLTSTAALRDLRVLARNKKQERSVVANDTLFPTWPAQAVPRAEFAAGAARAAAAIRDYIWKSPEGFAVLAMTPQVMRWRHSLTEAGKRDTTIEDDPFRVTPNTATPTAKDPITQWSAWREMVSVSERRAVVVLNVSPDVAAFPELPARVVDMRRGDVSSFYLQRGGQRVLPIEAGKIPAVGNADDYRAAGKPVFSSGVAAYAPGEFDNLTASYEVVVIDARRPTQTFTIPLPAGMIQAIASDFAWMKR